MHTVWNENNVCVFLDTMENWDEKKLEEVVNKKHGEAEKKKAKTQIVRIPCWWIVNKITWRSKKKNMDMFIIWESSHLISPPGVYCCVLLQVCKYFLDAIENNKYGWFWVCPGGGDNCMYRHALPPGFVLKKDKKKEEKDEEISLEELIENEVWRQFSQTSAGNFCMGSRFLSVLAACSSGTWRYADHPRDLLGMEEEEKAGEGWTTFIGHCCLTKSQKRFSTLIYSLH